MSRFYLMPFVALSASALLASAFSAQPRLAAELGLDYWNLPTLVQQLLNEQEQAKHLEANRKATLEQGAERRRIVTRVRAGQMSLAEAIAGFREIDATLPPAARGSAFYPGRSEEEKLGRHVIAVVSVDLESPADETQIRTARLEAELQALLASLETATVTHP